MEQVLVAVRQVLSELQRDCEYSQLRRPEEKRVALRQVLAYLSV